MGIRYRKSINLGKGFRVNMSKTGPGFSWGGKGYRITRTANGNIRGTAYMPGTGISYQKDFGNPHKKIEKTAKEKLSSKNTKSRPSEPKNVNIRRFENDLSAINPGSMADVIKISEKNRNKKILAIVLVIAGIGLAITNPLFLIIALAGIIFLFYNKSNEKIAIDYDMTEDAKKELDTSNDFLAGIMESDQVWLVRKAEELAETSEADMKINQRISMNFSRGNDGIETNAETFTLSSNQTKLIFLPDALFIKEGSKMSALNFNDMEISLHKLRFLEEDRPPADATLLGKTYEHSNKDGSPDKRFKENKELNIVEYGVLSLYKEPGLNSFIVFSDTVLDGE